MTSSHSLFKVHAALIKVKESLTLELKAERKLLSLEINGLFDLIDGIKVDLFNTFGVKLDYKYERPEKLKSSTDLVDDVKLIREVCKMVKGQINKISKNPSSAKLTDHIISKLIDDVSKIELGLFNYFGGRVVTVDGALVGGLPANGDQLNSENVKPTIWKLLSKVTDGEMERCTHTLDVPTGTLVQVSYRIGNHCAVALEFLPDIELFSNT